MVKCIRLKTDGSPCLAPALKNSNVCFFHCSNSEFTETVKQQNEAFDLVTELKEQLKRAKKIKTSSIEKTRLIVEILKLIDGAEAKTGKPIEERTKTEAEEEIKRTPRDIILGLGK
jgi:hypothetical protein